LRLLVNADDPGLPPKANAAIFQLMSAGRIRSATLLPNGRAYDEAVLQIANHPHCSFGESDCWRQSAYVPEHWEVVVHPGPKTHQEEQVCRIRKWHRPGQQPAINAIKPES